jgi:hypothetical protein
MLKWVAMCRMISVLILSLTMSYSVFSQTILETVSQVNEVKVIKNITIPHGWSASGNEIYGNVLAKENSDSETTISFHLIEANMRYDSLESIIKFELDSYREFASERFEVKNAKPLLVDNEKSIAVVKHVFGAADAAYQAIAYIPESKSVLALTLSTDDHKIFSESLSQFEEIVKSYTVINERIQMVTKNTFY